MHARALLLVTLAACGGGSDATPEVVVRDASLGGAPPVVLGATASTVWWTAASSGTTRVGGAPVATVPATGTQVAMATGPVAAAGEYVVFVNDGVVSRVDVSGVAQRITPAMADSVGGSADAMPLLAWTTGAVVSWGRDDLAGSVTLNRVDRCDHVRAAGDQLYVAADGTTGRRLLRIDTSTATIVPGASASTWSAMFPGGGMAGATYTGRIVDATEDGALWLVEEMPSRRALVVEVPVTGDVRVGLDRVQGAGGMFATADEIYWQEGAELLVAPRAGGAAAIVASLPGAAGALAGGYVYFTHGAAIERLRVD